jgi:hypothetical protein
MQGWKPTRIRWVGDTLDTSTGAARVETDQGPAFAKLMGNPEGPQALFCELLGTRAAAWLGLRTFDVTAVDVGAAGIITYANGTTSEAGPAFVARFENGTTWGGTAAELQAVENPDALAGIVVLDTWLLNCDRFRVEGETVRRNTRNVFLSEEGAGKGKFKVTAMDHTHILMCGRQLTKAIGHIDRVKDERLFGNFPEFREYLCHQNVRFYADQLLTFSRPKAEALLSDIPQPWSPTADVRLAVAEFLCERARFVGQNIRKMLVDQGTLEPTLELEG